MKPIFGPGANLVAKLVLLGAGGFVAAVLLAFLIVPQTEWETRIDFPVGQPVPFSHEHHVAGLGLDCRFCHATVQDSATAGMPSTQTCMTCHSQVWTNAAILEPVRQSLASGVPIQWNRVNRLPDYVYFDHSIHVAKGIGCENCHGRVDEMALTSKQSSLRMAWCVDCHTDPKPNLRPTSAIFEMGWRRGPDTPSPEALFEQYHIHSAAELTDCSVCHR